MDRRERESVCKIDRGIEIEIEIEIERERERERMKEGDIERGGPHNKRELATPYLVT